MKVRLEIIDEDGIESTNVEFGGKHWKRCLLAFIDSIEDENPKYAEPSSAYSHTTVNSNSVNPNAVPGPIITGPVPNFVQQPVISQPFPQQQQAIMQQPVHSQQQQFQQQLQQQAQYQQYQQQLQQQQQSPYPQQYQYYQPPAVVPYQYYGQPAQAISTANPQQSLHFPPIQPAVPDVMPSGQQGPSTSTARTRSTGRTASLQERMNDSSLTINERLELFLKYEYPRVWFSSQSVQHQYERIYGSIKQSTVSTYLSRMYQKTLLERRGNRTQREYRYVGDEAGSSRVPVQAQAGMPQFHRNSLEYG